MEVVPTGDGDDDDGVIWFRCPQCQGFLPKLSGADLQGASTDPDETETPGDPESTSSPDKASPGSTSDDDQMPWDSPADMMAAMKKKDSAGEEDPDDVLLGTEDVARDASARNQDGAVFLPEDSQDVPLVDSATELAGDLAADLPVDQAVDHEVEIPQKSDKGSSDSSEGDTEPAEPIMEYAAMLGEVDPSDSSPYRPWGTYEVGQCIHHLAWDDCGVVVAKETLPGGRQVIKVFFEEAGVVRLIEQAPR